MVNESTAAALKFPIGPFVAKEDISKTEFDDFIATIANAPAEYRKVTINLSEADLRKTYRDGAWNVQQVVSHVADMQLLHFLRMKKALTEPDYKELTLVNIDGWAQTADGRGFPLTDALDMFEAITRKFVLLIKSLSDTQKEIAYYHPVRKTMLNQKQAVAMSAWHVRHHLEHIKLALSRQPVAN